ncbi:DUF177 domain-containing protein [candidate division KSB1 bacterium]
MILRLRGLKQGEHSLSFDEPASDYDLDAEHFPGTVHSDVMINLHGKNYYIKIKSSLKAVFECDRCLDSFEYPIDAAAELICTEDPSLNPDNEKEGLYFLPVGGDTVKLDEDIRQSILLLLPMKLLCSEECKGLCPECGINRNHASCSCDPLTIDPRWEALKKLN